MKISLDEAIRKIKTVEIQGATQIATFALEFLIDYSKENGFGKKFDATIQKLEKTRPTAVVLHNVLKIVKQNKSIATMKLLLKELKDSRKLLAEKAYRFIPYNATIMTHCHSGDAVAVIKKAHEMGRNIKVYATITEPLHQGTKTAKDLKKAGIDVTIINDNAVGFFMKNVDMVVIGSDAIRKDGIINKIGSLMLAITAKYFGKPLLVFSNSFKIDERKSITIEERPANEILRKDLELRKMKVKVRNPAFDLVPWNLVEMAITEKQILIDFDKRIPIE
ncbi:MAG: hypothetical protein J7K83_03975 [Candidatus Aenigmarchaeota archaeon]|nr:hypothetical protein [Candidatus Aenigmarchaeota archaeon]